MIQTSATQPASEHSVLLHVSGMHCTACTILIRDALEEAEHVKRADVSLSDNTVQVHVTSGEQAEELAARLTPLVSAHGYALHAEPAPGSRRGHSHREWLLGGAGAALVLAFFMLLERMGIASLIGGSEASLGTALVVGLVASVSTCLAVVGAMVLSVSATYAHEGAGKLPQLFFHAGRFVSFFLLGGLLGVLGEAVRLDYVGSAVLGAIVSIVMVLLGLQLLEVTSRVRALTLPTGLVDRLIAASNKTGKAAPFLLGAATFFLPCGFTQSMQIVALGTQSFWSAALTMSVFALGTFPVLALLSYGSLGLAKSSYRGAFFKAAGMLVIVFALFNLWNGLAVLGLR